MRSFVVVGGCKTLVPQVLLALRSAGNFNCILLGGPDTRKLRYSLLCDERLEIDFDHPDDEHVVQQLLAIARRTPDATLLPVDCASVRMMERVRSRVPLRTIPLPDVETMDMFDDKWRFFQFCRQHGLPVPDTVYIGSKDNLDFEAVAARLGTPFILKPSNEAGSTGVQVIRSEQQFQQDILANPAYRFRTLIAQRFVSGVDVCIDLFALRGWTRAMAFRKRDGAMVRFFDNEQMRALGQHVVAASLYNGVMNMDARIEHGTGKVYLLESNPRFWASLTASAGAGLNFVAHSIDPPDDLAPLSVLTDGEYHTRHPLMRPSAWGQMLFDQGGHGRLLRAKMTDMQAVGGAVKSLAAKPMRMLPQLFVRERSQGPYDILRR